VPDNSDAITSRFNEKALKAFLDGLLDELRHPQDPKLLEDVRRAFRKKIPLHLRSYAAALMILRAAGLSRAKPQQKMPQQKASPQKIPTPKVPPQPQKKSARNTNWQQGKSSFTAVPSTSASIRSTPSSTSSSDSPSSTQELPSKETVSLFVSMGKRHHLKPQELRNEIAEHTGLSLDEIGRIHLLEKYSFIEVPEKEAQKVIAAMNGAELNGHVLEIKPAKKRAKTSFRG